MSKRTDYTNQEAWLSYVHNFKCGDHVTVEAKTFSGPWQGTIEKTSFFGNCNDAISIRNGILRNLNVYDITSI